MNKSTGVYDKGFLKLSKFCKISISAVYCCRTNDVKKLLLGDFCFVCGRKFGVKFYCFLCVCAEYVVNVRESLTAPIDNRAFLCSEFYQ